MENTLLFLTRDSVGEKREYMRKDIFKKSFIVVFLWMIFAGIGFAGEREKQHSIDVWKEK